MTAALAEVIRLIKDREPELRRRGVVHLALYGEITRGKPASASGTSEVDVAVEIETGISFSLIRLEETRLLLADTLNREVDLAEAAVLGPAERLAFDRDKVLVF